MSWGTKDVGLWLNLLIPRKPTLPVSSSQPLQLKKGFCFSFNEGQCKWPNSCRYKHECASCSGNHPASRCFKRLHSNMVAPSRDNFRAGSNTGEIARHVAVPSQLAKPQDGGNSR